MLEAFDAKAAGISPAVFEFLQRKRRVEPSAPACKPVNVIIGNNATAVDASGMEAERLGYSHAMQSAAEPEGAAEEIGRHLADMALRMRDGPGPDCLVSGGEPVVTLCDAARRGKGGRNQQLVLAALERLAGDGASGIAILSGGTDGEDGPTDAAGAVLDASIVEAARQRRSRPGRLSRPKRRLPFLRAARRPAEDRPDAHERLRHPRGRGEQTEPRPLGSGHDAA